MTTSVELDQVWVPLMPEASGLAKGVNQIAGDVGKRFGKSGKVLGGQLAKGIDDGAARGCCRFAGGRDRVGGGEGTHDGGGCGRPGRVAQLRPHRVADQGNRISVTTGGGGGGDRGPGPPSPRASHGRPEVEAERSHLSSEIIGARRSRRTRLCRDIGVRRFTKSVRPSARWRHSRAKRSGLS